MKKIGYVAVIMALVSAFWIGAILLVRHIQLQKYEYSLRTVASKIVSQMNEEEMARQIFILYAGIDDTKEVEKLLPGAVFLNKRNIPKDKDGEDDLNLLREKMESIHQAYIDKNVPPPFYTIDQEWGYIRRLEKDFTDFPSAMALGEAIAATGRYDLAMLYGFYMCLELRENGVQWPFVPVADVQTNPENPVIGVRSFGSSPEAVAKITEEFLTGMQTARCMGTLKHFPGHGDTRLDSHKDLPHVSAPMENLEKRELYPYLALLKSKHAPRSIMTAHIVFETQDENPATLSQFWLKDLLKTKWGYEGLVITDDLEMNAVKIFAAKNDIKDIPLRAFLSGTDMLLILNTYQESLKISSRVISSLLKEEALKKALVQAAEKVMYYKLRLGVLDRYLVLTSQNWSREEKEMVNLILRFSTEEEATIRNIEGQLAEADSINEFISRHAIKTLVQPKENISYKGYPLYTDLPEDDENYARLKSANTDIYPLQSLSGAKCLPRCAILHTGRVSLNRVLEWKKNQPVIIFSVSNPFPKRKYIPGLTEKDVFISSFSNTKTSQKALTDAYLSGKLPPKASVLFD